MFWKKSAQGRCVRRFTAATSTLFAFALACSPAAQTSLNPIAPPLKARDADGHTIVLNKPGMISVVLGTSEDSQNAARRAGKAMYPFQGLSDFQLIVVVDLRDSIAAWVPSIVISRMRRSLDDEAIELKPYYLKNGNRQNPRHFIYVVPDFKGTVVPQLRWVGTPDELHATLYGADGRELKRWENVDSMEKFQNDVRAAINALSASAAKKAALQKEPARTAYP